jgi:asparagine synthase (glutamine-hydrolysing)
MCGISINKGLDNNLAELSKHRGIYTSDVTVEEDITLTHHTLPIQVTDKDAQSDLRQPVRLDEGYMLFNGELFSGYDKDKFDSDTAYLKALFFDCHNRGQVIQKLNTNAFAWDGFWALVIYTAGDGAFTCYTDPLGKKPLYFHTQPGHFGIASEIKSVLPEDHKRYLDMKYLGDVRKFGYNNDDRTPYRFVKRMQHGMIYMFAAGDPAPLRLNGPQGIVIENGRKGDVRELLREAVISRIETVAEAKVACLLSGGLDSSIIAALLIERGLDVDFYTIENEDDAQFVADFEKHYNIKVERLKYNQDDVLQNDDLFREIYLDTNECPIDLGSVVPQYYLMKTISEAGDYRVIFTGDGADELFGGYSRIHEYDSQGSDVFSELPYYHLPRLDKSSMRFTLELRNPFLSHAVINAALAMPISMRTDKLILKTIFRDLLPASIIDRPKLALKNPEIRKNKIDYRNKVLDKFISLH